MRPRMTLMTQSKKLSCPSAQKEKKKYVKGQTTATTHRIHRQFRIKRKPRMTSPFFILKCKL